MPNTERDDNFMSQFRCPTGTIGREVAALMNREHDALTNWGLSHVKIEPTFRVLDVGCGGGRTMDKLVDLTEEGCVFGVDYSKDMVKFSKKINREHIAEGQIHLLQGSVQKLSFLDHIFDLVVGVETYYFWGNLSEAFREVHNVLKTGGRLLLVNEMVKDGKFEVDNARIIARTNVHLMGLEEIEALLRLTGFEVETFRKACSPWNALLAKKV